MPHESLSNVEQVAPQFEYHLLTGHHRTDGSYKTSEQLKSEYVRLTDDIVHRVLDGVEAFNPETGERETRSVDTIVWLDKSARPVSWLMKELWPVLATDRDGNTPRMPQSKFVNIDRNQWTSSIDPEGQGQSDISGIDQSIIRSLRSLFLTNPNDRQGGLTEAIDAASTQLDGKTVLIVDEVHSTGRTLNYAQKFFERAFPKAWIAGTHWMGGVAMNKQGGTGNADLPVWYTDKTVYGRGVGNRNVDLSLASPNTTQRLGAWFLSTALGEIDPLSQTLRREIHQLGEDVRAHRVLVDPSRQRDIDDFEERAVRLNGMSDTSEYITAHRQQAAHKS